MRKLEEQRNQITLLTQQNRLDRRSSQKLREPIMRRMSEVSLIRQLTIHSLLLHSSSYFYSVESDLDNYIMDNVLRQM